MTLISQNVQREFGGREPAGGDRVVALSAATKRGCFFLFSLPDLTATRSAQLGFYYLFIYST